jgi:GR25 family glycosyltransferase involved in LPS biosynthesis
MAPLTIGIGVFFKHSIFSNGAPTCAFSLAEGLTQLGHKVMLVNLAEKNEWYEDCLNLQDIYERKHLVEIVDSNCEPLDMFIDIDGFLVPALRRKLAKRVIIFIRKPFLLHEIETCVYPVAQPTRNLTDCDAIWMWDIYSKQDAHAAELLAQKPVFRLSFLWTSKLVQSHTNTQQEWTSQLNTLSSEDPWETHVMETNMTITSNMTIPMVQMSYIKTHTNIPVHKVICHNPIHILEEKFFVENVLNHCKQSGLDFEFVPRIRSCDLRVFRKSCVVSHTRFMKLKAIHLDLAWNGIPFLHNSTVLRDLGCGLDRYYYPDNSITGAAAAFQRLNEDFNERKGMFALDALAHTRSVLETVFSMETHKEKWEVALNPTATKTELVIGFSDLWDSANPEYNFWVLLLREAGRHMNPPIAVRGVGISAETATTTNIDALFFGPFGNTWEKVPEHIPKFHITGENTEPRTGNGIVLNFGFRPTDPAKKSFRFPLWLQYIDWFGANQDRLLNPRTMPVDDCCSVSKTKLEQKKKFCAFIVSNPTNQVRNTAFQTLSMYKQVDSAGRLFNNVGNAILTEIAGGGGGELKKLEFLRDYKFAITYENNRGEGYITEKLLAAKAAGCVPIYWGALNIHDDFPAGSFINANVFSTPDELITAVRTIDEDNAAWEKMASIPAVDPDAARCWLAEAARLVFGAILPATALAKFPIMIGGRTTAEARKLGAERKDGSVEEETMEILENPVLTSVKQIQELKTSSTKAKRPIKEHRWNGKTLLVSCATQKYLESLTRWLQTTAPRVKADPNLSVRCYLGEDIGALQVSLLKSQFDFAELRRLPTKEVHAPGFEDLWEPQHFAWKLWIYQDLVQDETIQNTLVWYMDAASVIVRMPNAWFAKAAEHGLCMLEDEEQYNSQWCHEIFVKRLIVTPDELAQHQVVGGIMAFIAGATLPWKLFTEAWVLGQQRDIIVGPKWAGIRADGKPFGHRHDQSILSLLRLRRSVPVEPLSTVYNHESLRRTFKSGQCLYIHRGTFKENEDFAPRIGDVHIISLPRRKDRIERFKANHESWTKKVCLCPAVDGRAVSLTPAIAKVFKPNDFFWKKAVLGCALSHLSLWTDLANESPACENYLILEDDVKFQPGWLKIWEEASKHIPEDYDVLYLGGVLPPNRPGFMQLLEPVNTFWGRISLNQAFGQPVPNRYFHFCNYAYILSRRGAQKLLSAMQPQGGYHTSADHMICNRVHELNHYILNPIVAGCYQDEDPKYQSSSFNDFSRIDGFDSDLWNNDERFSPEEVAAALDQWKDPNIIPIAAALADARNRTTSIELKQPKSAISRFTTIGAHKLVKGSLLEYSWLETLFGSDFDKAVQVPVHHEPLDTEPIFMCMKPHLPEYMVVFDQYERAGKPFYVLHLSDEFGTDPIEWMDYSCCKGIIRMYVRPETMDHPKVLHIPLGPYRKPKQSIPLHCDKMLAWSFHGTKWMDRQEQLAPFLNVQPSSYGFYDTWMDAKQQTEEEYAKICSNSTFMPCPRGQNAETFRFWEALEYNAIPLYVPLGPDDLFFQFVKKFLPILDILSWEQGFSALVFFMKNQDKLQEYRRTLFEAWANWKVKLSQDCARQFNLEG